MTDAGGEGDIRGGDHYEEVLRGENVVSVHKRGKVTSHLQKGGEGGLQIVLLARFGALWCQEREH